MVEISDYQYLIPELQIDTYRFSPHDADAHLSELATDFNSFTILLDIVVDYFQLLVQVWHNDWIPFFRGLFHP